MTQLQSFDEVSNPAQGKARIAALRRKLAEAGLDGFVVPRSDEHQNEYARPRRSGSPGSPALPARRALPSC